MKNRPLTVLLVVLSAALLVAVAVLLMRDDDPVSLTPGEPQLVSAEELSEVADQSDHPVYWVGERDGVDYELTETTAGQIFVRYLEGDAAAGDERADFVTVATYPSKDGVAEIKQAVRDTSRARLGRGDNGAFLLIDPSSSRSAHLAYPGADSPQIEVYSPVPGEALRLASRGVVQPLG
jgi:hypothetical protein